MRFEQYCVLKEKLLACAVLPDGRKSMPQPAPLVLAYLGDAVFSLCVRERLAAAERGKVRVLNDVGAQIVCAAAQASALEEILPLLTPEETAVVRRGRNAKSSVPKNATLHEYRQSTGFECLLGWLHWRGDSGRLCFLLDRAFCFLIENLRKRAID
ncbi:MAG: ribonuclease III [Acidaminococcales bacterium]|jgi:ribonuclease-3 family protein|nr:ribonuclease III [Acidaminococcales bacterium]